MKNKRIDLMIPSGDYWNSKGKYSEFMEKMWELHVPERGNPKNVRGELVRAVGRLQYEYCNNGNCNAIEYHEDQDYFEWTLMYSMLLEFIRTNCPNTAFIVDEIEKYLIDTAHTSHYNYSYSENDYIDRLYNLLQDQVGEYLQNTDDDDKEITDQDYLTYMGG